jgi:hypothetical protein
MSNGLQERKFILESYVAYHCLHLYLENDGYYFQQ